MSSNGAASNNRLSETQGHTSDPRCLEQLAALSGFDTLQGLGPVDPHLSSGSPEYSHPLFQSPLSEANREFLNLVYSQLVDYHFFAPADKMMVRQTISEILRKVSLNDQTYTDSLRALEEFDKNLATACVDAEQQYARRSNTLQLMKWTHASFHAMVTDLGMISRAVERNAEAENFYHRLNQMTATMNGNAVAGIPDNVIS